ncbi:hypothetical protein J437_LFUL007315, partial [Ladona fulva]
QTEGEDIANAVTECIENTIFHSINSINFNRRGRGKLPLHNSSRSALCADISRKNFVSYGIGDCQLHYRLSSSSSPI